MKFIETAEGYVDIHAVNAFAVVKQQSKFVIRFYFSSGTGTLPCEFDTHTKAEDYLIKIVKQLNKETVNETGTLD